jgi:hypothetical protein
VTFDRMVLCCVVLCCGGYMTGDRMVLWRLCFSRDCLCQFAYSFLIINCSIQMDKFVVKKRAKS